MATDKTPKRCSTPAETLADAMRLGRGYVGDLAQPLNLSVPTEEILRASPDDLAALKARLESERMAEIARRLDLLFAHYRLERGDFTGLALALAFFHVPGLQAAPPKRRRGRPTKQQKAVADALSSEKSTGRNALVVIGQLYAPKGKGKSGRPIRWDAELQRALIRLADDWKQSQKAQGRRTSDAAWVRAACKARARNIGERESEVFKREGRRLAVALSRARKSVSKA
jgi:hypothetical protein